MGTQGFDNISGSQTQGNKLGGNPSLNHSARSSQAFFFCFVLILQHLQETSEKEVAGRTLTAIVTEKETGR